MELQVVLKLNQDLQERFSNFAQKWDEFLTRLAKKSRLTPSHNKVKNRDELELVVEQDGWDKDNENK